MPYEWMSFQDAVPAGGSSKAIYKDDPNGNDLIDWLVPITERRGSATSRLVIATADIKFLEYRLESSAPTGDNRGMYLRLYFTVAGAGGGESLRAFTTVENVEKGTAHGAHISLNFDASGSLTGLGVAMRATLHIPNAAMAGGTYAAVQAEIYGDGTSADPAAVTQLSFIRIVAGGGATERGAIDDKAYLLVLDGVAEGAGNMVVASATEANYASAARCLVNGVEKWLMFASASG